MKRVYSSKALLMNGKKVMLAGWVSEKRKLGSILFIILRDREGIIQLTLIKNKVSESLFNKASELRKESVISVKGVVKSNTNAPGGAEVIPEEINVISVAEQPIPLDISGKIKSNLDKRLDWRVLDLRRPEVKAIFVIRAEFLRAYREFLRKNGFIEFNSPKILESASESGANVFPIIYLQKEAFLAQSPQFYKQSLIAAGFDRVFETAPVFRAEPHHTTRHVNEYTSLDFEMGFINSFEDIMKVSESLVVHMLKSVKKNCSRELELLGKSISIPSTPFPRITMTKAYELLQKEGFNPVIGDDLSTEEEKALGVIVKKKYKHDFVFLTKFPWKVRPFYTYRSESNPEWTDSFDLIYKGVEMVTGGQREHRYDVLVKQAEEKGIHTKPIQWYFDMFKYGVPPHGGQGMGLGRVVKQFLDLENIREAVMFPRDPDRLAP